MVFNAPGKENTAETLKIALEAARAQKISRIVVASGSGYTVDELLKLDTTGMEIIAVTRAAGYKDPHEINDFPLEKRKELEAKGVRLVTASHVLSGAERGISKKFTGVYPVELIAHSLRMLGQGMKVCVEISVMACDCGYIPYQEPVVVVGGTRAGADTAVILRPAHAADIFECKVDQVLCKPILK